MPLIVATLPAHEPVTPAGRPVKVAPVAAVVYPALYNFNYHGIVSSKLSSINDPNPAPTHPPAKFIEPILPYAT